MFIVLVDVLILLGLLLILRNIFPVRLCLSAASFISSLILMSAMTSSSRGGGKAARLVLVEKLKEVMIFLEKTVLKAFFKKNTCLFIWDALTKSDRLFSLDCDFQPRPEQATARKAALPRDFPRNT